MPANKLPFCHLSHPFSFSFSLAFFRLRKINGGTSLTERSSVALCDICNSSPERNSQIRCHDMIVGIPENVTEVHATVYTETAKKNANFVRQQPGWAAKQEHEEMSRNHVRAF